MIEICFFVLVSISIITGIATGNMEAVSNAVLDGAQNAISVIISLCGAMCLWNGIMEVLNQSGAIEILSKFLSPILSIVYPQTWKSGIGKNEVCAATCANLLGIGNAATPLALSAMSKMSTAASNCATNDMVTFAALGASSIDLMPTMLIALRRAAGSTDPYNIIVPIWICSVSCATLTVILCKLFSKLWRSK